MSFVLAVKVNKLPHKEINHLLTGKQRHVVFVVLLVLQITGMKRTCCTTHFVVVLKNLPNGFRCKNISVMVVESNLTNCFVCWYRCFSLSVIAIMHHPVSCVESYISGRRIFTKHFGGADWALSPVCASVWPDSNLN